LGSDFIRGQHRGQPQPRRARRSAGCPLTSTVVTAALLSASLVRTGGSALRIAPLLEVLTCVNRERTRFYLTAPLARHTLNRPHSCFGGLPGTPIRRADSARQPRSLFLG
jgi:hypothetical protein